MFFILSSPPRCTLFLFCFFFFNDTATTEIYTLSLHDALPICRDRREVRALVEQPRRASGASGRRRTGDRIAPHRPPAAGHVQRGATQPRAAAVSVAELPALARGVPPSAADRAGVGRRLERHRPRAGGAETLPGRAQRVRASGRSGPRPRRGALQPELHLVEPRRLRRRAARDQAGVRARSLLRLAEVRARDRPAI